jgi:hypothetical protein
VIFLCASFIKKGPLLLNTEFLCEIPGHEDALGVDDQPLDAERAGKHRTRIKLSHHLSSLSTYSPPSCRHIYNVLFMDTFTDPPVASASASGTSSESSGGGCSGYPSRKTRLACDRCHTQKLKCVRKAGNGSRCERCLRLKTACRFGPRVARSPIKFPEQVAVGIRSEDPLSVPASMSIPAGYSDVTIAGASETEWPYRSSEHTDPGGRGQLARHISIEIYPK